MAQTGSMIAFIVLVVIVVIGVLLYAYLTMMNQAKDNRPAMDPAGRNRASKYLSSASFFEFAHFVGQNQPAEWILPLAELNATRDRLEAGLIAGDPAGGLAEKVDDNLESECVHCGLRIAGRDFYTVSGEVCSTPNCGSTQVTLRWLAVNADAEDLTPAGESADGL